MIEAWIGFVDAALVGTGLNDTTHGAIKKKRDRRIRWHAGRPQPNANSSIRRENFEATEEKFDSAHSAGRDQHLDVLDHLVHCPVRRHISDMTRGKTWKIMTKSHLALVDADHRYWDSSSAAPPAER